VGRFFHNFKSENGQPVALWRDAMQTHFFNHAHRRYEMNLSIRGIRSDYVAAIRDGGPDAHGQAALHRTARGTGNPCRHCLSLITEGEDKLILAYRPFDQAQPYAEVGPIFLHRAKCERYDGDTLPEWFSYLKPALIRGYGYDDWIKYETADVVPGSELTGVCHRILADPLIAYVHIRSKFNCFQCRVERADGASG
jgi:Protein of unknown function (DUF1203)